MRTIEGTGVFYLARHSLLALRITHGAVALCMEDVSNSEIIMKKHKNVKKYGINTPLKGHWFTIRAEARRQSLGCPAGSVGRARDS